MAYVQRGTTALPPALKVPSHATEQSADNSSSRPEEPLNGHRRGSGASGRSAETPGNVRTDGQGTAQQIAQSRVSMSGSPSAEAKHSSHSNSSQPLAPEAPSWFLCTDEIVKPVSWDAVARCQAYILLYMRTK